MVQKRICVVALMLSAALVAGQAARAENPTGQATTITIAGEWCGGCLKKVKAKLASVDGTFTAKPKS